MKEIYGFVNNFDFRFSKKKIHNVKNMPNSLHFVVQKSFRMDTFSGQTHLEKEKWVGINIIKFIFKTEVNHVFSRYVHHRKWINGAKFAVCQKMN